MPIFNVFDETIAKYRNLKVKQFIAFPYYIIVIDDGVYLEGYITTEGKYSEKLVYNTEKGIDSTHYSNAKYVGGGTWSVIDYTEKIEALLDIFILSRKALYTTFSILSYFSMMFSFIFF